MPAVPVFRLHESLVSLPALHNGEVLPLNQVCGRGDDNGAGVVRLHCLRRNLRPSRQFRGVHPVMPGQNFIAVAVRRFPRDNPNEQAVLFELFRQRIELFRGIRLESDVLRKKGTSLFRARFVKRGETAGADRWKIFS